MAVWGQVTATTNTEAPPTLFLDRDGVVVRDKDYLSDPAEVEILPGVAEAMIRARQAGFQLIGVSNQSGIGRGYFGVAELRAVMARLTSDLKAAGAWLDGFYYCPHAPDDKCSCRKPGVGLLTEAAGDFRWDPALSWVIGDKSSDVGLGLAAGLGAALVRTGYGATQEAVVTRRWPGASRLIVADDLASAVSAILDRPEFVSRKVGP